VGYVPRDPWVDEVATNVTTTNDGLLHATTVTWKSCSSSQQSTVNTAIASAKNHIQQCKNYLTSSCDSKYVTLFGHYAGTSRWSTVATGYDRALTRLSMCIITLFLSDVMSCVLVIDSAFTINCSPSSCGSPPCYAYVYPTDSSHTIHLCYKFW
jgi:peptidyl-Lys metalloendopeptidase